MNVELVHHASLRRADIDALELVFCRDLLLNQFGVLSADVREVLAVLGPHILIDLQDLDPRFGDLALRLGDRRNELSTFTLKSRLLALQRRDAVELNQLLGPQLAHALELFLDPFDLLVFRGDLRDQPADFFLRLRDTLTQLRLQSLARLAPDFEKPRLAHKDALDLRVAAARREIGRKFNTLHAVDFGFFARLSGHEFVQALDHNLQIGAGLSVVELDHDIPGTDDATVAHIELGDHSTGRVLHLLHVAIDDHLALRDHRAGEFAGPRPAAAP